MTDSAKPAEGQGATPDSRRQPVGTHAGSLSPEARKRRAAKNQRRRENVERRREENRNRARHI